MNNKIQKLKQKIERSATIFQTGGLKPENNLYESWIGRVYLYCRNEDIPLDQNGNQMLPLAQFYLPTLPFVPEKLKGIKVLTIFISKDFPDIFEEMGNNWLIREYYDEDILEIKQLENSSSYLKPFPLTPKFVTNDCPIWDGGGLDDETENEILAMENEKLIEDYYDITEHYYETKFGGYPSFMQSGIGVSNGFGEGFEFIFQISSDEKANLNVVDSGSFMFAKSIETQKWSLYYDFC